MPPAETEEFGYMFAVWRQFHWLPEDVPSDLPYPLLEDILARLYLKRHSVNPQMREFAEAAMAAPWCFYMVMSVEPGQSMELKNLLTDEHVTVTEKQASAPEVDGEMLFTTVVTLQHCRFMLGCAAYSFPPPMSLEVVEFAQKVSEYQGSWNDEMVREYDTELFDNYYWDFRHLLFNPPQPEMHNTDGEPLPDDAELEAVIEEFERVHWQSWLDTPIPALNGQTPRQAALTQNGRQRLEVMLTGFDFRSEE